MEACKGAVADGCAALQKNDAAGRRAHMSRFGLAWPSLEKGSMTRQRNIRASVRVRWVADGREALVA
jgi:hypothetical protein